MKLTGQEGSRRYWAIAGSLLRPCVMRRYVGAILRTRGPPCGNIENNRCSG